MATFSDRLAILITADGKGAVRELESVGRAADKNIGGATARLDKFGYVATRTGAAMVGAAAVIGVGLASTVKSAQESERAQIRLQNTIAKMPRLAGANIKAFNDQAAAIQRVTVASDEEVTAAQAMLGTFQLTQRQLLQATPLVVDFARKFNVDLVKASIQVGKAFEGQIGALKRQGISIDENLYKADRFGAVLKALREQAGGFAVAEGKTFEGQLKILGNQMDEFKESVGRGVVGVLNDVLPVMNKVGGALGGLDEETGGAIGQIATLGTVTLGTMGSMLLLAGGIAKVKAAYEEAGGAASRFGAATRGIGFAASVVAVAISIKAAYEAFTPFAENAEKARDAVLKFGGSGKKAVKEFESAVKDRSLADLLEDWATGSSSVSEDKIRGEFRKVAEASITSARNLLTSLREEETYHPATLRELADILDDVTKKRGATARAAELDAIAAQKAADALASEAEKTQALITKKLILLGLQQDSALASLSVGDAADREAEALARLNEENTPENQRDFARSHIELEQAILAAAAAAGEEGAASLGEYATAEDKAAAATFAQMAKLNELKATYPQLTPVIDAQILKLLEYGDTQPGTPVLDVDTGPANSKLDVLLGRIGSFVSAAAAAASRALDAPYPGGWDGSLVTPWPRAKGGPVRPGTLYLVGEKGPELFASNTAGSIVPNHALVGASAAGVGTTVRNYAVTVQVAPTANLADVGRATVEAIRAYERGSGNAWRNN